LLCFYSSGILEVAVFSVAWPGFLILIDFELCRPFSWPSQTAKLGLLQFTL